MNTDEQNTNDLAEAPGDAGDAQPTGDAGHAPEKVANSSDEEWDEQPGDDIGNRLPGAAPQQASRPAEAGTGGDAKKRKRNKKRKGPPGEPGQTAEAGPDVDAEASADAGEGESTDDDASAEQPSAAPQGQGSSQGKRRDKHRDKQAAQRERPAFSVGEEVFGKVCKVTDQVIWVDIAGKAIGLFNRDELPEEEGIPIDGDQFIATVSSTGVRGGMLMLCRGTPRALDELKQQLEAALANESVVFGFVTGTVRGGLEVDLGGLRAFAPASHVDLRHGADLSHLVGQRLDFIVTQYAKKGRDIVVSRKKMLDEDARQARTSALSKVAEGSVHKGIVRKVVAWGVFVALPDAGGVEGLIHMTEASHDRSAKLTDIFRPGAEIDVKVMKIDDKGKLWLSHKATTADPWDAVKEKYAVGTRHKGKIARLQPFGAFIELEPGIDGLCHTADIGPRAVEHPSEAVKVGDEIDVVVSSCDAGAHKIGLHPALPAGEDEPRQRVQQYKSVKVVVVGVTEAGLTVRILGVTGRAARGFIPAGHTGTARGTDLRKDFPPNMKLDAKVLEIDPRRGEAKLSIRALKEDAEKQAYQAYRSGVAREAKFGTFADLMKKHQN